jgi:class 3 adenylate cyclase
MQPDTRYAWNGDVSLAYQVVLHTGEVERSGDQLTGLAVHAAARVVSMGGPSEVLVSQTVKDLLAGAGLRFEERGLHELKGVPGLWGLYEVVPAPAGRTARQG